MVNLMLRSDKALLPVTLMFGTNSAIYLKSDFGVVCVDQVPDNPKKHRVRLIAGVSKEEQIDTESGEKNSVTKAVPGAVVLAALLRGSAMAKAADPAGYLSERWDLDIIRNALVYSDLGEFIYCVDAGHATSKTTRIYMVSEILNA